MNQISKLAGSASLIFLLVAAAPQKPARQFLSLPGLPRPSGYNAAVVSEPGRMVFISGQQGFSPDGKLPPDFASQAKNTFENVRRCLELAGTNFDDVVKVNYYVTDLAYVPELHQIRARYFHPQRLPTSTLVRAGLGRTALVEVEVIAITAP